MEILIGAILEALLSLAGPVARSSQKAMGRRRLAVLFDGKASPSGVSPRETAAFVTRELTQAGYSQRDTIDCAKFVDSPEGQFYLQVLVGYALSVESTAISHEGEYLKRLDAQGTALMDLYFARETPLSSVASTAIRTAVLKNARPVLSELERLDTALAANVRAAVADHRISRMWADDLQADDRTRRIRAIVGKRPTDIQVEIRTYAERVRKNTSELTIPIVAKIDPPAIETAFIPPRLKLGDSGRSVSSPWHNNNPLIGALETTPSIILLGEPGAGKSTSIQAAVHDLASRVLDGDHSAIPIQITLRHYAQRFASTANWGVLPEIKEQMAGKPGLTLSSETLEYLLESGRCVIFFDGLDEVLSHDRRTLVATSISEFVATYGGCSHVVTSRPAEYEQVSIPAIRTTAMVCPFTDSQVETYAEVFFRTIQPGTQSEDPRSVTRFMVESAGIGDIRTNPLLLNVLCNFYATGRRLPVNRAILYERCAEMLFAAWDESKEIVVPIEDQDLTEDAVLQLALRIFQSGSEEIAEPDLEAFLKVFFLENRSASPAAAKRFARDSLKFWKGRQWLLIEAGDYDGVTHFKFSHRTFLEYFAARQLVFESAGGAALWEALEPEILSRSATAFCHLAVQMMGEAQKGSVDQILEKGLDHIQRRQESDRLGALNVAFACSEFLSPVLRAKKEIRFAIVRECITLLADLVPPLEQTATSAQMEFYSFQTITGREGDEPFTIDYISSTFANFELLALTERAALFDELRTYAESARGNQDRMMTVARLACVLRLLPDLESWQHKSADWCEFVRSSGGKIWDFSSNELLSICPASSIDLWVAVEIVRTHRLPPADLVAALGTTGIMIGGSIVPALSTKRGTPAHNVLVALLRDESDTAELQDELAESVCLMLEACDSAATRVGSFGRDASPGGDVVLDGEGDCHLSPVRAAASLFVTALLAVSDIVFVERVSEWVPAPTLRFSITKFADLVLYPRSWDGFENPLDILEDVTTQCQLATFAGLPELPYVPKIQPDAD